MNFHQFAETHGLIINNLVMDKWMRVPTIDHPHKRNGAYIFDGQSGAVQNWAVHEKPISWHSKEPFKPDPNFALKREKATQEKLALQQKAAQRAHQLIKKSVMDQHPYLIKKGFDTAKAYVLEDKLVLPMRVDQKLVGCQIIQPDGTKKFLFGQRTKGASLTIDNKGRDILCEGFATALSVRRALRELKERYTIHVCFSAGNMLEVAKGKVNPLVIADNDPVGLRVAKKIGDYWASTREGEDFNDAEMREGTAVVSQSLIAFLGR
jgi:putative DNA primase/helicase